MSYDELIQSVIDGDTSQAQGLIREALGRSRIVKLMVGGAPVTDEFAQIGGDAYAPDAASEVAVRLVVAAAPDLEG